MKRLILSVLTVLSGLVVSLGCSGCIFAAVEAVRYVDKQVNPPQPVLEGSSVLGSDEVKFSARLRPFELRRKGILAEMGDAVANEPSRVDGKKDRMILWATLTNTGKSTKEINVVSIESALGKMKILPSTVSLAPGQRAFIQPLLSPQEKNLEALDVTIVFKSDETAEAEKQTVSLHAVVPEKEAPAKAAS